MNRACSVVVAIVLMGGAAASAQQPCSLDITLAHDSDAERATRAQLLRVVGAQPAMSRWVYTRRVVIDDDAIPHSHPVLTLHARHLGEDSLLLSTFVHEQMHWWLEAHAIGTRRAVARLRRVFAHLPVGHPDGAQSERSSYEHLLVIHFELAAVRRMLGERTARGVLAFWERDHYRALYRRAPEREAVIARIAREEGVMPAEL